MAEVPKAATRAAARMLFPGTKVGPASKYPHVTDALEAALPALRKEWETERDHLQRDLERLLGVTKALLAEVEVTIDHAPNLNVSWGPLLMAQDNARELAEELEAGHREKETPK